MKVLVVFGTRPEAIKLSPLISKFKQDKYFETRVCITSQHKEMLIQVMTLFDIEADYNLDIMKKNQDLFDITSNILNKFKLVLEDYNPDIVVVQGDTTTAFIVSLCAFYKKIKVVHVEAGLRTNDKYSPFPEEINRQLISKVCDLHFCPTELNKRNLLNEGIKENNIFVTGNTGIDSLKLVVEKVNNEKNYFLYNQILKNGYNILPDRKFILVTGHRRENFGRGFEEICSAIKNIALNHRGIDIVYPVHLNPNVRDIVFKLLGNIKNIYLIKPLDYLLFTYLMMKSHIILTDSGGIQEETSYLGIPTLVMREKTERLEATAKHGNVILVGTNSINIKDEVDYLLTDSIQYMSVSNKSTTYGNGTASEKIINIIKETL